MHGRRPHQLAVLTFALLLPLSARAQDRRPDPEPATIASAGEGRRRPARAPEPVWREWLTPQGVMIAIMLASAAASGLAAAWQQWRVGNRDRALQLGAQTLGALVTALHKTRGALPPEQAQQLVESLRAHSQAAGVQPVLGSIVDDLRGAQASQDPASPDELRQAGAVAQAALKRSTRRLGAPPAPEAPVV